MTVMTPLHVDVAVEETQTEFCVTVADNTESYRLTLDVPLIVRPVPSNYGRIDWNGAYLTVS